MLYNDAKIRKLIGIAKSFWKKFTAVTDKFIVKVVTVTYFPDSRVVNVVFLTLFHNYYVASYCQPSPNPIHPTV